MAMEIDHAAIKRLRDTTEYPALFKKEFAQEKEPIAYDSHLGAANVPWVNEAGFSV